MWLLNQFPADRVGQKFGFRPDQAWLDHVRLSSVRLSGGCSGSFVSPGGLVLTNHHCVLDCVKQLSSRHKDFAADGFLAREPADERACTDVEVDVIEEITDVSAAVEAAGRAQSDRAANEARKAEMSRLEQACATSDKVRCDVVSLYHGGMHQLYRYHRFQDVRLVFVPESAIAFFGGDPDNFNFPRYDLDVAFVRVYRGDGTPAHTRNYLRWSQRPLGEGDLTFVSGHPGATARQTTVAQLEYERDVAVPARLYRLSELRGLLIGFQRRGAEQKRVSEPLLLEVENSLKALKGRHQALLDPALFGAKVSAERALRASVEADPAKRALVGGSWDAIARAELHLRAIRKPHFMLELGGAFHAELAAHARTLVRAAEELAKPNEVRLREYADSQLPERKQRLLSTAPISDELEVLTLTHSLTLLREELGADHPMVREILGRRSPAELAGTLIGGTKLKDVRQRRALLDGGKAAVDASTDPLVVLQRQVDPFARAVRKDYEDNVEAVEYHHGELIARARFAVLGTSTYPDATFTLRLSYGTVRGWLEEGQPVAPITTLGGVFDRATGAPPFALPKSWLAARDKLDLATPFNFCTTNDVVGGNSGSPVIDRQGEIGGVVFDGNIHSLGGGYWFDDGSNRAVAVHGAAILEVLDKIYGASRLREELTAAPAP
ncbi:MAG: S46 family peptidase [Deltaproteobacteria bacterium]|nr:S46 family peptidase [Deltaproteobacteria bacterium]